MSSAEFERHFKYILLGVFLLVAFLAFLVVRPFIGAMLIAVFIAYVLYPIYRRLHSVIRNPNVASLVMTFLVLVIILVPLVFVIQVIVSQMINAYSTFSLESAQLWFASYFSSNVQEIFVSLAKQLLTFVASLLSNFVISIPQRVLNGFVLLLTLFFAFKDGEKLVCKIESVMPVRASLKKEFISHFSMTTKAVVYGVVIVSFLQGVAAMVGFYLFGFSSPALWGFVTFIAALLPMIGPAIVWVPLALIKYFSGNHLAAFGIVVYSLVVQTLLLDVILKARVIGIKGKISPLTVLVGIVGGLSVFGIVGIIVGPLVLVLLIEFLKVYVGKNASES